MKFECRITRSCIYWHKDHRETLDIIIEADSLEEAKIKLHNEAIRLEIRTASKLVQDVMIKINGEWKNIC